MLICHQVNKQIYLSRSLKRLFFKYKYNLKMQSTISRSSPWPILFLSFIASSHIGTTGTIATNFSHVIIMEMQKRFLEYMDITYCLKSYTESNYVRYITYIIYSFLFHFFNQRFQCFYPAYQNNKKSNYGNSNLIFLNQLVIVFFCQAP